MHQFFQQFGHQGPQTQSNTTPELDHNLMVLEIGNNWNFVRWLMYRIKENMVKEVDQMETAWHQFITTNQINIDSYKNAEDFMEKNLRALVAEEVKEKN